VYAITAMGITATASPCRRQGSLRRRSRYRYLVFTGFTTVRPLPAARRQVDVASW